MKSTFLQRCFGLSLIAAVLLFGTGFLFRSMPNAEAAPPKPEAFIDQGTNQVGIYMMHYVSTVVPKDEYHNSEQTVYYEILVWNTVTGESKLYHYKDGEWVAYSKQLPSSPL